MKRKGPSFRFRMHELEQPGAMDGVPAATSQIFR